MNFHELAKNLTPEGIPTIGAVFYNALPARMFRRFYSVIANSIPVESGKVLDIGTGPGYLPIAIARIYPSIEVVGIDVSKKMIEIARRNADGIANVDFLVMDANKLEFDDEHFDFVVSSSSSHHWRNPVRIYDEIHRVLKKGGQAWIYELYPDAPKEKIREVLPGLYPYPLFKFVAGTHGITEAKYQKEIKDIIRSSKFSCSAIEKQSIAIKIVLKKRANLKSL